MIGEQYVRPDNLEARIALHRRFGVEDQPWAEWVRDRLPPNLTGPLLDLGCGTGALWSGKARPGLLLADRSQGMVELARRNVGVPALRADAMRMPFANASFDLVVASHMLYHLPDLDRGLWEIRRVLRRGGVLVATTNGLENMGELYELIAEALPYNRFLLPEERVDRNFLLEPGVAAFKAVFERVEMEPRETWLEVTEAAPLVAYVASWTDDRGAALDEADRKALMAVAEARLARDGVVRIRRVAGVLRAQR